MHFCCVPYVVVVVRNVILARLFASWNMVSSLETEVECPTLQNTRI